ncbi:MAG TPA: hypothetical protein V6C98_14010 [Thermosynechococcaceae cyanobacterium]|jgi:hypothetical protein
MTQAEITYTPKCANCPFAVLLEGDRYECTAVHNHHSSVVRGHWQATPICEEAIERLYEATGETAQAEFNQYIETQADAIAPESDERGTGRRQPQTVTLTSKEQIKIRSIMPQYLTEWVVIGSRGNAYQLSWDTRTKKPDCSCRAGQFNRKCYHGDAVLNEWKRLEDDRRQQENQVLLDRLQRSVFDQSFQNRNKRLGAY